MKIVEVEWEDSCFEDGWQCPEQAKEHTVSLCKSVGYLFNKDKKHISIMQNTSSTGHVSDQMAIPRSCIKKITYLRK